MSDAPALPRLLVLASTYPRWAGDPEPGFVHELAKRLVDRFHVTVLCPHAQGAATSEVFDGVHVQRYRYAPVALEILVNDGGITTNLRRRPWSWLLVPTFLLGQVIALIALVARLRPAVIHAHWLIPQGLLVAALRSVWRAVPPFVVTSHGADLFALRGKLFAAMKRFVLRRASVATVVSEGMRSEIERLGIDARHVRVEPMGVDLQSRFVPDAGIARDPAHVLFVGRLVEKKGLRYLIEAMPQVLAACPDATLTIAGFGPEAEARRAQAEQLGIGSQVRFIGAIEQSALPALYRRATLFVAPFVETSTGDQEGLGLVVIEALGCGCPVVISRLAATSQLIDAHPAIRSVEPGRSDALATMLIATMRMSPRIDPIEFMPFDWTKRADAYAQLLEETYVA